MEILASLLGSVLSACEWSVSKGRWRRRELGHTARETAKAGGDDHTVA